MSEKRSKDPMLKRLRKLAGNGYEWLHDVADRLEQLQMPHVDVLRIAEVGDDGADAQALIKALCKKVESQRRQIVRLQGPEVMTAEHQKVDSLSLKWGTLKSWDIHSETGRALLKRYFEIGASGGAMTQMDTPEQKDIICQLIDGCAGDTIYLDWDNEDVPKEEAKDYVKNYGKRS